MERLHTPQTDPEGGVDDKDSMSSQEETLDTESKGSDNTPDIKSVRDKGVLPAVTNNFDIESGRSDGSSRTTDGTTSVQTEPSTSNDSEATNVIRDKTALTHGNDDFDEANDEIQIHSRVPFTKRTISSRDNTDRTELISLPELYDDIVDLEANNIKIERQTRNEKQAYYRIFGDPKKKTLQTSSSTDSSSTSGSLSSDESQRKSLCSIRSLSLGKFNSKSADLKLFYGDENQIDTTSNIETSGNHAQEWRFLSCRADQTSERFDGIFGEWEDVSHLLPYGSPVLLTLTVRHLSIDTVTIILENISYLSGIIFRDIMLNGRYEAPHSDVSNSLKSILEAAKAEQQIRSNFTTAMLEIIPRERDLRPELVLDIVKFATKDNSFPFQIFHGDRLLDLSEPGMGAFQLIAHPVVAPVLWGDELPKSDIRKTNAALADAKSMMASMMDQISLVESLDTKVGVENFLSQSKHVASLCKYNYDERYPKVFVRIGQFLEECPRVDNSPTRTLVENNEKEKAQVVMVDSTESNSLRTFYSQVWNPEQKPVPVHSVDSPNLYSSLGQKQIGTSFDQNSYQKMITMMKKLRMNGLLLDLGEETRTEINQGSDEKNEEIVLPAVRFSKALIDLERASNRTDHPVWQSICRDYQSNIVEDIFKIAIDGMKESKIKVWEVIRTHTVSNDYYESCFHVEEDGVLHTYVNRTNPNLAEAILYSCAKAFSTLSHTSCVLLESLLLPDHSEYDDERWLLSHRIRKWLSIAPHAELARLIVNGRRQFYGSGNPLKPPSSLSSLCAQQVSSLCQSRLLEEVDKLQESKEKYSNLLGSACLQDCAWARLFDEAAWSKTSRDAFVFLLAIGMKPNPCILKHAHQRALDEIYVSIRRSNSYITRQPDLITVYNEFLGRNDDCTEQVFGLSKHDVSRVLYDRLREDYLNEDPSPKNFLGKEGYYFRGLDRLLSKVLRRKKHLDGLFFMFPLLFSLLSFFLTGVAPLANVHMPFEESLAITVAIVSSLPVCGCLNNVISPLSCNYLFACNFELLADIQLRILSGYIFVYLPVSILCMVLILVSFGKGPWFLHIFGLYSFLFSSMFLLIGALFNSHFKSVWKSPQGRSIIFGQILSFLIVSPLLFRHDLIGSDWLWLVHAISLLSCDVFMFICLCYQHKHRLVFYRTLKLTPTDKLVESDTSIDDFLNDSENGVIRTAKARAQRRDKIRKDFCHAVTAKRVPRNLPAGFTELVVERRAQLPDEELLFKWYSQMFSIDRPEIASEEWDIAIEEAQKKMTLKSKTNILHRGGLFANLLPRAALGLVFFVALLVDQYILLGYGDGQTLLFSSSAEERSIIQGWALIYTLLAYGALEIVPFRITAGDMLSTFDDSTIDNTTALSNLIHKVARKKMDIYKSDLWRMLSTTIPISAILSAAGLFWILQGDLSVRVWTFFLAAVFSYTGLVLASFNMLFLTNNLTVRFALLLGSGVPLGIALSITAIKILESPTYAIVALGVSTWSMYFISLRTFLRQVRCDGNILQDEVLTTFALQHAQNNAQFISGQKWIGGKIPSHHLTLKPNADKPARLVALNKVYEAKQKDQTSSIVPGRGIGRIIEGVMEESAIWWSTLDAEEAYFTVYARAGLETAPSDVIMGVLQSWRTGRIKVEQCSEKCLFSEGERFSALGKLTNDSTLEVFVGIGGENVSSAHATRVAEAMIHEYVEMVLQRPHHTAVFAELLLHKGAMTLPYRVQRQIELMDVKALRRLQEDTAVAQLKISTRDVADFSERWSSVSKADRYSVVRRLRGDFLPNETLLEGQIALSELIHDACSKRLKDNDRFLPCQFDGDDLKPYNDASSTHPAGLHPLVIGFRTLLCILFLQVIGDPSVHHELYHAENADVSDGGLPLLLCFVLKVVGLRIHRLVFALYSTLLWQFLLFFRRENLQLLRDKIKQLQTESGTDGATKAARRRLWQAWSNGDIDGIFSIYWDERLLREDASMKEYWYFRDRGWYKKALEVLESNYETINQSTMIDAQEEGVMTHLCFRMQDLRMMGTAGQSPKIKDQPPEQKFPNEQGDGFKIRVAGLDSGTWPTSTGGVSSCRRDLVERLPRLSWTMYPEVGNSFQVMKHKFETNIESMNFIWLWGCDVDGPNERMFSTTPAVTLAGRKFKTTDDILQHQWAPILRDVVGLFAMGHTQSPCAAELDKWSLLCLRIYDFFQEYDWNVTWSSPITRMAWRQAWMLELEKHQSSKFFRAEQPTSNDLDMALAMTWHFLMPLSTPIEALPVYHGSHHGPQLLLAVIAKLRFGSSVIIWDHGLVWRERITSLSESHYFTLFVRNVMTEMVAFASRVIYHNSDAIVSCNSRFNPQWQTYIGGGPNVGSISCERTRKKLSPVVNGMAGDAFKPCRAKEEPFPCAVMLSHVYPLKDVMNAIHATNQIVNVWNLKFFRLIIYGSTTKDVEYVANCKSYIASNGLGGNVFLMGSGLAPKVLPRGWVFLNSSASEGLPLALGEAGLAGLPVVCTNVGGSHEVVSDSEGTCYGGIVPPRDPEKLARAILRVLSMTDELGDIGLSAFSGKPTELEERIYESSRKRRLLGMKYRCFVKTKFGIDRYLREHEQVIAWCALCNQEMQKLDKSGAIQEANLEEPIEFDCKSP